MACLARRHSSCMSREQVAEIREVFDLFDRDRDGKINRDELGKVMRSLGQHATSGELDRMIAEADVDGDGSVGFEDFVDVSFGSDDRSTVEQEDEREMRDAFRVFDKHNRGYITASDLRVVLHCLGESLTEDEIEDMIDEVDVSGNGRIDFNDFVKILGEPSDAGQKEEYEGQ